MSLYRGDDVKLTVTTGNDGARSFNQHDDRWNSGPRNHRRRGRGGGGGGGGGGGSGGGPHYHKDHYRGGYQPRSGYRGGGGKNRGGYRGGNRQGPYNHQPEDLDGDIAMGGDMDPGSRVRFNPYGSRPRSQRGRRPNRDYGGSGNRVDALQRMGLPVAEKKGTGWYKSVIPYGKYLGKDELIKLLNDRLTVPFDPIGFFYEGKAAIFYVVGHDSSEALRSLSGKLTFDHGKRMNIIVRSCSTPHILLDDNSMAKLQECMSRRYDPTTKTLDLTCMYNDESLNKAGVFIVLNRPQNMERVVDVIGEHIPEMQSLDLTNNRLLSLSPLTNMVAKAPQVTKLSLAKNQLRSIDELDKIKGWALEEIILEGNDFCNKFTAQSAYISAVRDKFPKVVKLDDIVLPPPITFAVETCTVPAVKGSYFLNSEIQEMVVKFLKEYFTLYDSDNRQGLIDAYHDNALFSMSVSYNPSDTNYQPRLNNYISESRNLLKKCGSNTEMRGKLLRIGRVAIAAALCLLPKSTHDPSSMMVDVNYASETLLTFTVSGVFKETDCRADKPPIRTFSRVLATVPYNGGMAIINDMLTISNALPEQSRNAFKSTGPTPSSSPVSVTPQAPATPTANPGLTPEQQQMVLAFSQQSGMNAEWSAQCLEQNGWEYDKSAQIFTTLNAEGKIPPEAFVK